MPVPPTISLTAENGWLGGLTTDDALTRPGEYLDGDGIAVYDIDPSTGVTRSFGTIRAGPGTNDITNVNTITDGIRWMVVRTSTNSSLLYAYCSDGRLNEININTDTVRNDATFPRLAPANSSGQGLEIYKNELWYASGTQLNKFDFSATFTEPVGGHTGLTNQTNGYGNPHPLTAFDITGRLYIGDANLVRSTDGTTMASSGTYTLTLPSGSIIECIRIYGQRLLIGVNVGNPESISTGRTKGYILSWDGITADFPNDIYEFPEIIRNIAVNGNRIFIFGGKDLYEWRGDNTFDRLIRGTQPINDGGFDVFKGILFWNNTTLHAFGSPYPTRYPNIYWRPSEQGQATGGTSVGKALKWVTDAKCYVSIHTNTNPKLVALVTAKRTTTGVRYTTPNFSFPLPTSVVKVQLILAEALESGDSIAVTVFHLTNNVTTIGTMSFASDGAVYERTFTTPTPTLSYFRVSFLITNGATTSDIRILKINLWLSDRTRFSAV